jgi:DNA excision repair protein ERCC-3
MAALLFVQNDGALLVQSDHPLYETTRETLLSFAELRYRMDPIHVYQIRPVTLWQAASLGVTARAILTFLRRHAAHPIPYELQREIVEQTGKWGRLVLHAGGRNRVVLRGDEASLKLILNIEEIRQLALEVRVDGVVLSKKHRAHLKRLLTAHGYPVVDRAGYQDAPDISFALSESTKLRPYQLRAVESFFAHVHEESGVVVLPCGAGKTLVGIAVLERLKKHALILTPSDSSARQWERELLGRTTFSADDVGLYEAGKELKPVTITTYQRVAARTRSGQRKHLAALTNYPWGIVIYDEVHMLPAPLFRLAADLQGARRLGLTATLVREDGAEHDVFSLIGPKCFDIPWKQLEQEGYLASVRCVEVGVPLSDVDAERYRTAGMREKHKIAALNPMKLDVVEDIIRRHPGEGILVIGHYLASLEEISTRLKCPLMTGKTPANEREQMLQDFRVGKVQTLVLSRVANMAIDLPRASVAIQVSGQFGSRQEEAQRLGRLLRPQTQAGVFYTLVSRNTVEERMAKHRQLYLVERGYAYEIVEAGDFECERVTDDEALRVSKRG